MTLFSVPIFFIVFRETIEAAIIVSVLLGLAEQIVHDDPGRLRLPGTGTGNLSRVTTKGNGEKESGHGGSEGEAEGEVPTLEDDQNSEIAKTRLIKKLRIQIFVGAGIGLFLALSIGAAFIAIWFTQANDLWQQSEELWEGIFELIASLMIFVMGVTMLKMDRAKAKWRLKLQQAFDGKTKGDKGGKAGRWVLLILPLITVLREGLEAVVFVGGVSLGQSAKAIPIASIVGLVCGLLVGFVIYEFASRSTLTLFLIGMTNLLLLIGAGLFSRATLAFETNAFNNLLGTDVDDAGGDGPGSYDVRGNVWHLDCCNPENNVDSQGWGIFNAIFGWTNSATIGSILSYVFYWLAVIVTLIAMKFYEGRTTIFGYESSAGKQRRLRRSTNLTQDQEKQQPKDRALKDNSEGNSKAEGNGDE